MLLTCIIEGHFVSIFPGAELLNSSSEKIDYPLVDKLIELPDVVRVRSKIIFLEMRGNSIV